MRRDLATIATTTARFEPVSMLVRAELDDLWMRDTGPVFVRERGAVDFNFYVCNGAVIGPEFGDAGGGIHRTTQQQPR